MGLLRQCLQQVRDLKAGLRGFNPESTVHIGPQENYDMSVCRSNGRHDADQYSISEFLPAEERHKLFLDEREIVKLFPISRFSHLEI